MIRIEKEADGFDNYALLSKTPRDHLASCLACLVLAVDCLLDLFREYYNDVDAPTTGQQTIAPANFTLRRTLNKSALRVRYETMHSIAYSIFFHLATDRLRLPLNSQLTVLHSVHRLLCHVHTVV